ncbi:MAG: response regulator [Candidatus Aminicenantes bacterium]|nr:response regulator [Candidatus Aminicenantes bacterium]
MTERKKILIVDYDSNSLKILEDLFNANSLMVITAADGQQAYDIFKKEQPDLVLLEAMLPKLHGFDLTQKIYNETKGSIPVVIVTGLYKGPQYKNEALRSFGAADYFEKPYDKNKLLSSVMNLLQDEVVIEEDLPDPASVLEMVSQLNSSGAASKKQRS